VVQESIRNIDYIVDQVAIRGWSDNLAECDDFEVLRRDVRVRGAQVAALYEEYFLPERHEFEWNVLVEIVEAIVTSAAVKTAGDVVVAGVAGSAAYDLLKALCLHTAAGFRKRLGGGGTQRAEAFEQLAKDSEQLKRFFEATLKARIREIEEGTGLNREKLYPLMKIAGLRHQRRGDPCYWTSLDRR